MRKGKSAASIHCANAGGESAEAVPSMEGLGAAIGADFNDLALGWLNSRGGQAHFAWRLSHL